MTTLRGSTVLITGGAAGIGRLVAIEAARRGAARVVLWDLDADRLDEAGAQVRATGAEAFTYRCDVGDAADVASTASHVHADVGAVDVLVNNAGIVSGRPLLELTDEQIERTFRVNVLSLYWVTRAFLPSMQRGGAGHVVTVASAAGLTGVARQTDYSASKHAAVGFNESLRVELHRDASPIRTTVVCPFYIDTGMFSGVRTRVPWLLPILQPADVSRRIADAIESDRAMLALPPIVRLLPALRILPVGAFDRVMDLLGVNASMDEFTGH